MAKAKKVREHNPINWKAVFRMATAKKSNGEPRYTITEMAQKLGYYNKQSNDPTQEFRGMLSRARTIGITMNGKKVKLAKATVRRGGKPAGRLTKATPKPRVKAVARKAAPKKAAAAKKVVNTGKKVVVKAAAPQKKAAKVAGKNTVAIQQHESGRVVSVKIGDKEALVSNKQMVPQLDNLAHQMGYKLVPVTEEPKQEAVAPAQEAVRAEAPAPSQEQATETPTQERPKANDTQAA